MTVARLATSQNLLSEVNDQGALARFAPLVVENEAVQWRLGACVHGSRHARGLVRQIDTQRQQTWVFEDKDSKSRPQLVVRAWIHGLARLRSVGAQEVTVVVVDRTLVGYFFHAWRVRSLAMHAALQRLLEATSGLRVVFEPPRPKQGGRPLRA